MPRLNVVWNITQLCTFKCRFCCVSSRHISGPKALSSFKKTYKTELSLQEKIQVVDQLSSGSFSLDLSGGDILLDAENISVIRHAVYKLGSSNVSVTIPGPFVDDFVACELKNVASVEVSIDQPPESPDPLRPSDQNIKAVRAIKLLSEKRVNVEVQTVLRRDNASKAILKQLYSIIVRHGVQKWSILRLLPVGRGNTCCHLKPSLDQYQEALCALSKLSGNNGIAIHFQYLLQEFCKSDIVCRAAQRSIGITSNGTVVSCFWARNPDGEPIPSFILGNVPRENINDIVQGDLVSDWRDRVAKTRSCFLESKMDSSAVQ